MNTKKKPFNDYTIKGDIVVIYLPKRDGRVFECLIDLDDLEKVKSSNLHFRASYYKRIDGYYAVATEQLGLVNGKFSSRTVLLHRLIASTEKGQCADHKNHNSLDNRKENLRVTTNGNNTKHRKSKNINNKSGYRNVCKKDNKWIVQLQINGKSTVIAKFKDIHEAALYAEEKRKEFYGEFAGCG